MLLGLVGLAVTETALWGRRQQDRASLNEGLLEGVAAAMAVTASDDPGRVHDVADRLLLVLGVDAVGYDPGPIEEDLPVLGLDGRVRLGSTVLDVSRRGLPNAALLQVPVGVGATNRGRFLVASTRSGQPPTLTQLHVAAVLACDLGSALARSSSATGSTST